MNEEVTTQRQLGRIEEKLDGISRRLDISNGRLAKNEDAIVSLQKADILMAEHLKSINGAVDILDKKETLHIESQSKFYWEIFRYILGAFVGVLSFLGMQIFNNIFIK